MLSVHVFFSTYIFLNFKMSYCVCVCVHTQVWKLMGNRRGHWVLCSWTFSWLWAAQHGCWTRTGCTGRAASVHSLWVPPSVILSLINKVSKSLTTCSFSICLKVIILSTFKIQLSRSCRSVSALIQFPCKCEEDYRLDYRLSTRCWTQRCASVTLALGRRIQEDPWGSLTSQPSWSGESFSLRERSNLESDGGKSLKWKSRLHTHTYLCENTHEQMYTHIQILRKRTTRTNNDSYVEIAQWIPFLKKGKRMIIYTTR